MQIKNKIFPYPILNQNVDISDYNKNSIFNLTFDGKINASPEKIYNIENNKLILNKVSFILEEENLKRLFSEGKVECSLIVENAQSMFRKNYKLSLDNKDIEIDISKLFGKITLSAFIFASEDINNFKSPNFNDIYNDYTFKIGKFDILAADDGYNIDLDTEESKNNNFSSIFTIVSSETKDSVLECEALVEEISIKLPTEAFNNYNSIKSNPIYKNIAFSMIAIPALSKCLQDIQTMLNSFEDLDDIIDSYRWFRSVCIAFEREKEKELTIDLFNDMDPLDLAQIVLNYSICKGLYDFNNLLIGNMEEDDE